MLNPTAEGYVKHETHQHVTTIEFHHSQSNSLPAFLLESLAKQIHHAANDPLTHVIVLKSTGEKVFCSGASFDELAAITNEEDGRIFFSGFAAVINEIRKSEKFVIARIHGKCIGGGVGLAAAADYAIAQQNADIKLSELAVGIGPFVVGPAVERKIGNAAFSQLSIDASSWRSAEWAYKRGLFAEIHADAAALDEAVSQLSQRLSRYSMEAMKELKKILWAGTEHWDGLLQARAAISGKLVLSDFTKNFITTFKEKQNS
ncbi:MAG: enoyl-CoA hydratase/isomerase family protein [Bacteroidota bacterium]|nr:enoyl-CoA hydratase/isomerase family protein [Bacteroidota bacterium]